MFSKLQSTPYQTLDLDIELKKGGIEQSNITIKRIDKTHPNISGNKWYKLKYNFLEAKRLGYTQLLSFGGAYSNHIHALAHAAHEYGFESVGIIRGEELASEPLNKTLSDAKRLGMQLEFIPRYEYRKKHTDEFLSDIQSRYPKAYIIPEGGTNKLAIKGCMEILSESDKQNYDVIVCSVGTGGTISGIINASQHYQEVIGYAALKVTHLTQTVQQLINGDRQNWSVHSDETFGGYAKFNNELMTLLSDIYQRYKLPLEPIYTGKAMYQLIEDLKRGHIDIKSRVLFIHTGGLQAYGPNLLSSSWI